MKIDFVRIEADTVLDNNYYTQLNQHDVNKLESLLLELKKDKLDSFFKHLLSHNDFKTIMDILVGHVEFYKPVNSTIILNQVLASLIQNYEPSTVWMKSAMNNICSLHDSDFDFIHQELIPHLQYYFWEVEKHPELKIYSKFSRLIECVSQFLIEHPHYLEQFSDIPLEELENIINKVQFNQQLQHDLTDSLSATSRNKL